MITLMPSSILLDLLQNCMEKCVHQFDLPFVISHLRCHCRKLGINFPAGRERSPAPCLSSRHGADAHKGVGRDKPRCVHCKDPPSPLCCPSKPEQHKGTPVRASLSLSLSVLLKELSEPLQGCCWLLCLSVCDLTADLVPIKLPWLERIFGGDGLHPGSTNSG